MSELLRSTILHPRRRLLLALCLLAFAGFFVAGHYSLSRGDSAAGSGGTAPTPAAPAPPPTEHSPRGL